MEYKESDVALLNRIAKTLESDGVLFEVAVLRLVNDDKSYARLLISECRKLGVAKPRGRNDDEFDLRATDDIAYRIPKNIFVAEYNRQQKEKYDSDLSRSNATLWNKEMKRTPLMSWVSLIISIISLIVSLCK